MCEMLAAQPGPQPRGPDGQTPDVFRVRDVAFNDPNDAARFCALMQMPIPREVWDALPREER